MPPAEVRRHAEQRGVHLVGDLPIYLAHDSAEVWSRPDLFRLDGQGRPEVVAGCPPDAFTPLGQHWGNPMYRWEAHAREGFAWWVQRIQRTLDQVHTVRIDHFRGFSAGWAIPADAPDARSGSWSEAPGRALFAALRDALGALPFVAEDLGHLDASVHALRARTGIPGMRVLQFGFDGSPDNPHHPDRVPADVVVYPGTHDNNTVRGWFEGLGPDAQRRVCTALGCRPEDAHRALVVSALEGPAVGAVIAVQDLLGLGAQARMNTPGTAQDNWGWRMTSAQQAQLSEADWRPVLTAAGRVRR